MDEGGSQKSAQPRGTPTLGTPGYPVLPLGEPVPLPMATVNNAASPHSCLWPPNCSSGCWGHSDPNMCFPCLQYLLFSCSISPPLRPAHHLRHTSMKCNNSKPLFFCSLLQPGRAQLSFHGGHLQFYAQEIQGDDLTAIYSSLTVRLEF